MISHTFFSPVTPFYGGELAGVSRAPTSVGIDGQEYAVDLQQYRHNGLAAFREGIAQSDEPSDQLFDSQGAWWRYRFSWHHGAGQRVMDLDRDSDSARFWQSRGIDPWTKYEACLLPETEEVASATATNIKLLGTATHFYYSDGTDLYRTADLSSWSAITGLSGSVTDLTTDGTDMYVATATGIYTIGIGSVAATATTSGSPTNGYDSIAFVGNRLLAGDGDLLVEVKPTELDTIFDHYQAAFRWTTLFQVGSRIYVGGYAGNRSELFTTTVTSDGSLTLSAEAASFFAAELLNGGIDYGGSVLLATSKGVRFASLGGDGTLAYGPLIAAPGDVKAIAAEGRFAWFGWENFPDGGSGVGRLALDTFVDALQPAYATDVFTEEVDAEVTGVARFQERTIFAIANEGIYATVDDTTVDHAYLDTGEVYFGTVEFKSLSELRARFDELEDDNSIQIQLINGDDDRVIVGGIQNDPGTYELAIDADGEHANRTRVRINMFSEDDNQLCLRQWRARAYPIAPAVQEWLVPLIIHRQTKTGMGEGGDINYSTWAEVARLKHRWESKDIVLYQEGDYAYRVRIDNFQVEAPRWTDDGEWFDLVITVRLLSV